MNQDNNSQDDDKVECSRHREIWAALGLGLLSFLLYFSTFSYGFTFDDFNHIHQNELVTEGLFSEIFSSPTWPGNLYRPIFTLSLASTYKLAGIEPLFFHIGNIALNMAAVFALFYFLRLLFSTRTSFLTCLFFATHPIHVETVANVAHRSEILAALFVFLTLFFAVKKRLVLFAVSMFLALCSKESAACLVLLLPLVIWRLGWRRFPVWKLSISMGIAIVAYLFFRVHALKELILQPKEIFYVVNPLASMSFIERLPNAFSLLGYYSTLR